MRVTVHLAIALTIAFATAASAAPRHSTIPPITDTIRGVGTAALVLLTAYPLTRGLAL
jgi:hypothetical protein